MSSSGCTTSFTPLYNVGGVFRVEVARRLAGKNQRGFVRKRARAIATRWRSPPARAITQRSLTLASQKPVQATRRRLCYYLFGTGSGKHDAARYMLRTSRTLCVAY